MSRLSPELVARTKAIVEDSVPGHAQRFAASRRAAESARNLIGLMRDRAITDEQFSALADEFDAIASRLAGAERSPRFDTTSPVIFGDDRFLERYEFGLNGRSTVARPDHSVVVDDTTLAGEVTFGTLNEGTVPTVTTGPWIAYVVDLVLSQVSVSSGAQVTRELNIRYRRPVPTVVPLAIRGRVDETDGRTIAASCEILRDDDVLIEAHGSMVDPTAPRPSTG